MIQSLKSHSDRCRARLNLIPIDRSHLDLSSGPKKIPIKKWVRVVKSFEIVRQGFTPGNNTNIWMTFIISMDLIDCVWLIDVKMLK